MSEPDRGRPRLLWWIFGAVAGVAAAATVALFWLVRRPVRLRTEPVPTTVPVDPGDPPADPDEPFPPVAPEPDGGTACDASCNDTCDDACDDACDQVVGDTCDSVTGCSTPTCDAPSCDTELNCGSTVLGGDVVVALAGTPWLSMRGRVTVPARVGVAVIRCYQRLLSRGLGTHCRYVPSCSAYGVTALERYGALDGAMLTLARVKRCTPAVACGTVDAVC